MWKLKTRLALVIFVTLLFSHHLVRADFDPALKAALATASAQRDTTMTLVFDARARARKIERDTFPGGLPSSVPEFGSCRDASSGRFDDMRVAYNRIIDSIISGTATEGSIRDDLHTSVRINNVFLGVARTCLKRNRLSDFGETTISEAWRKIFTSYQSMKVKDQKKLAKHLDKKVRWKSTV